MTRERILIADDELPLVQSYTKLLSERGYLVCGTNRGEEALACLEEEQFDLLLVNFKLPDVGGLEMLRRAKELDPGITAIVITSDSLLKSAIDSLRVGARGFLFKPFDLDVLLRTVSEALEEHQREQENLCRQALLPILEISQALMAEGDEVSLAGRLLDVVVQQIVTDRASLLLLDEETDVLYLAAATGLPAGRGQNTRISVGEDFARQILLRQTPLVLDEKTSLSPAWRALISGSEITAAVCVPLYTGRKAIGVLNLSRLNGGLSFTSSDLNLLSVMGHQIAIALDNVRLYEAVGRGSRELALLNRAGQVFNSSLDLDQVLVTILEAVRRLLNVVACSVWMVDPSTDELLCQQVVGPQSETVRGWRLSPGEGFAGWVAQSGKSLIVPDVRADARHFSYLDQLTGLALRSILSVPLRARGCVIGVLQVVDTELGRFKPAESTLVESLAASAAIAVENARLFAATRHQAEQLEALSRVSQDLIALRDRDTLLRHIVEHAIELLDGDGGGMYLYYAKRQLLEWAVAVGGDVCQEGITLGQGEGLAGQVWSTGEPLIVDDYDNWPGRSRQWAGTGAQAMIGVPVQGGDEFLGVLTVRSDRSERCFASEDAVLLSRFATQAAIAIQNVRLYEQARQEIAERKWVEEALRESEQRFRDLFENAPLCIFVVDFGQAPPNIVRANRQAEKVYGWSSKEFAAASVEKIVSSQARCDLDRMANALRAGETITIESVSRRRDGSMFPVRVSAASETMSGLSRVVIIVEDITAEKSRRSEEEAIAEERRRIAREIHDGLAQDLASLHLRVKLWHKLVDHDPVQMHAELHALQELLSEEIREVRRAIFALRSVALDELGFYPALDQFTSDFGEQNQLYVDLRILGPGDRLPSSLEPVLFRIVQEALNNVGKHALARTVWIVLDLRSADEVALAIRDDGVGFDLAILDQAVRHGHLGFKQMRERVEALKGTFLVKSKAGSGTEINVVLPLSKAWGG